MNGVEYKRLGLPHTNSPSYSQTVSQLMGRGVPGSVGFRNFYFGVHALAPITLGFYLGLKCVQPFFRYDPNATIVATQAIV